MPNPNLVLFSFVFAFFLVISFDNTDANFNLFLSKTEVERILGLNAELYYIREGVVNDYAMKFSVKIRPDIHSIFFCWQSLSRRLVLYNMAVSINESSISEGKSPIMEPSLNVSLSGTIPKTIETFQLNLPCTGLRDGEVEVILNLNVTSPMHNQPPTVLYFNRRKICLKGIAPEKLLPRKSLQMPEENETEWEEEGLPLFVYIIYGIASLGLVIAVITAVACWKALEKRRKYPFPTIHQPVFVTSTPNERKSTTSLQMSSSSQMNNVYTSPSGLQTGPSVSYTGPSGTYTLPTALTGNSYASVYKFPFHSTDITGSIPPFKYTDSSCSGIYESSWYSNTNSKSESYLSSRNSKDDDKYHSKSKYDKPSVFRFDLSHLKDRFRQLQMDRERVRVTEVLVEGTKGRMYKGWLQREHPELDQQVVIKTVVESCVEETEALCAQGTLLAGLRHPNLVSLVGMSLATNSPPFLIFPDPQGTNFKLFLKSIPLPLKVVELIEVSLQAARGLSFLHANRILHTDVAARNCVVSDSLHLRITDNALARDFFPEDYEDVVQRVDQGHFGPLVSFTSSSSCSAKQGTLPVRWMAPETLESQPQLSSASDVWSLGVTLWEASTKGERPYCGVASSGVNTLVREGGRLRQSPVCPDDIFNLMGACWGSDPQERPTTQQVIEFLMSFRQSLKDFV